LAVADEEQTRSGISLRRLASSGDALDSLAVLRQQSQLHVGQLLAELVVGGDE
jgi:hypothetical protein